MEGVPSGTRRPRPWRPLSAPRGVGRGDRAKRSPGDAALGPGGGIETPDGDATWRVWTASASGKKLSNQDWVSWSDPEAKIAKMKDGTTHLAYKPEHAVDLDTGPVARIAGVCPGREGD